MYFQSFENFIKASVYKLLHPQITSFGSYVSVVLYTMVFILSLLAVFCIIAALIWWPVFVYKKKITPLTYKLYFNGNSLKENEKATLRKNIRVYKVIFALSILLIYIPILLPLLLIGIDIL